MDTANDSAIAKLEGEAVLRITSAQALAAITGDMAIAARALSPDAAQRLYPAFLLLAEVQAALLSSETLPHEQEPEEIERSNIRDVNAERCAHMLRSLQHLDARQRARIVQERTGWSKSTYYRARAAAQEAGLL